MIGRMNNLGLAEPNPAMSYNRRNILEFKWEIIKKKIVEDCMWKVTREGITTVDVFK